MYKALGSISSTEKKNPAIPAMKDLVPSFKFLYEEI
jgi:hypothetical protein